MRAIYVDRKLPRMAAVKALSGVWPGVCWSPLSPATVRDLPDPPLPGPRWIRVQNHQCGVCATDVSLLLVKVDPAVGPAALPAYNRIFLGHEVVGTVVEVGPGAAPIPAGRRIGLYHFGLKVGTTDGELRQVFRTLQGKGRPGRGHGGPRGHP